VTDTNVGDKTPEATQANEIPSPDAQAPTQQAESISVTENTPAIENATESEFEASESVPEKAVTIEEASKKYGAQAQPMIHTYTEGQDVAEYDNAYSVAYNMGMSGVSLSYAMNSEGTA
jgi:hypothetical protein